MGLFDIGKNLLRNLTQTTISDEAIENARKELQLDSRLQKNSFVKMILDGDYPKIIWGAHFLANEQDTRRSFNIDEKDIIIGFIRSTDVGVNVFATENLVLTDKGIYVSACKEDNFFDYKKIKDYVVVTDGDEDGFQNVGNIRFMSDKDDRVFMSKTIKMGTSGIPENSMLNMLLDIQHMKNRPKFLVKIKSAIAESRNEKIMDDKGRSLAEGLRMSGEADSEIDEWLFDDAIFSCNTERMLRFIRRTTTGFDKFNSMFASKMHGTMLQLFKEEFNSEFVKQCKKALDKKVDADGLDANQERMLKTYDNALGKLTSIIKVLTDSTLGMGTVSKYADEYYDDSLLDDIDEESRALVIANDKRVLGYTEREAFIKKAIEIKNEKALPIFMKIMSGEEVDSSITLHVDGFGLTPIHYAYLFGREELAKQLISRNKDCIEIYEDSDEDIFELMDPCFWAAYYKDSESLDKLIEDTEEIKVLKRTLTHLKGTLFINKGLTALGDASISSGQRAAREAKRSGDYDRYEELSDKVSTISDGLEGGRAKAEEIQAQIDEIEEELSSAKSRLRLEYIERTSKVDWSHGFSKIIKMIIDSPSMYERVLKGEFDEKVFFKVCGQYFYTNSDFAKYKNDHTSKSKAEKKNAKASTGKKKWFSDAAHKDLSVLSKEYHKLVAKYHPDNNPDGLDDFLSIQREREEILSKF